MAFIQKVEEDNTSPLFATIAVLAAVGLGLGLTSGLGHTNASSTTVSVKEGSAVTARDDQEYTFDADSEGIIVKNLSIGSPTERFTLTASNTGTVAGIPGLFVQDFDESSLPDAYLDQTQVIVTMTGQNNTINEARVTLREFVRNTFIMGEVASNGNAVAHRGTQQNYTVTIIPAQSAEGFNAEDMGVDYHEPFSLGFIFSAVDNTNTADLGRAAVAHGKYVEGTNNGGLYLIPTDEAIAASQGTLPVE